MCMLRHHLNTRPFIAAHTSPRPYLVSLCKVFVINTVERLLPDDLNMANAKRLVSKLSTKTYFQYRNYYY